MLHYTLTTIAQSPALLLEGALCGMEAIEFKQYLQGVLPVPAQRLVLDLRAVDTVDLAGLNALIVGVRRAQQTQTHFSILADANGPLPGLLAITKLHPYVPVAYRPAA